MGISYDPRDVKTEYEKESDEDAEGVEKEWYKSDDDDD